MADLNIDVQALANLARIEMPEEELKKLKSELPAILDFVNLIQEADASDLNRSPELRNVMREDAGAHESGIYTEKILAQAPQSKNDRVVVNQVVSRKKSSSAQGSGGTQ